VIEAKKRQIAEIEKKQSEMYEERYRTLNNSLVMQTNLTQESSPAGQAAGNHSSAEQVVESPLDPDQELNKAMNEAEGAKLKIFRL